MAPRSFSEDGAFDTGGSAGNPQATSVNTANGSGSASPLAVEQFIANGGIYGNNGGGNTHPLDRVPYGDPGFTPQMAGPNDPSPWGNRVPYGDPGFTPTFTSYSYPGLPTSSFAEGGAVPDGYDEGGAIPDDQDSNQDTDQSSEPVGEQSADQGGHDGDNSNIVSLALATVDSTLQYGRNKYGLTGGQGSGGQSQTSKDDADLQPFMHKMPSDVSHTADNDVEDRRPENGAIPDEGNVIDPNNDFWSPSPALNKGINSGINSTAKFLQSRAKNMKDRTGAIADYVRNNYMANPMGDALGLKQIPAADEEGRAELAREHEGGQ